MSPLKTLCIEGDMIILVTKFIRRLAELCQAGGVKLWLDDQPPTEEEKWPGCKLEVRQPETWDIPRSSVVWVKNYDEAIEHLKKGNVSHISFDNDLGEPWPKEGYNVAMFIEENVENGTIPPPEWHVHSANGDSKRRIPMAMRKCPKWEGPINRS